MSTAAPTDARPFAVVTGGSSGIGAQFARQLGAEHDVLIAARNQQRLSAVRAQLAHEYKQGSFDTVVADLSTADGVQHIASAVAELGREVDLLVNNAGAGYHGAFVDEETERVVAEVMLDVYAVATLSRTFLPGMLSRGRGAIINVASTAAFQPVPTMAVYGAAKAFVLSFSEALHVETRGTGVRVMALCPGGTNTSFFDTSGAQFLTAHRSTPEQVVSTALKYLAAGRSVAVPGLRNKLGTLGYRFVPRSIIARQSAKIVRAR